MLRKFGIATRGSIVKADDHANLRWCMAVRDCRRQSPLSLISFLMQLGWLAEPTFVEVATRFA
ncbi:hypothetical protein CWS35_29390 [Bradyrhizobium sp. SK17]|nr:hypothetical protein CWS35_29390 [Bradyrhizobium sp. SK17]